jgi:putative endonuclease
MIVPKSAKTNPDWSLYVIRTVDNCLYTGITTDVERRFIEHSSGGRMAARYFLAHKPADIVLSVPIGARSLALKVEYRFKQLSKSDKEKIIAMQKLLFDETSGEIIPAR